MPALALALGIAARARLAGRLDLHPDEALYAGWALRIADGSDPALLGVLIDKPPWLPYLLAGLFRVLGFDGSAPANTAELTLAARAAALCASSVSLVLFWLIARRLYGARVALLALALFTFSPLAIRLSVTLFTDPWLVLWLLLAFWAALAGRSWLMGIACGLAYATKQQAVLFLPLLAGLLLALPPAHASESRLRRAAQALQGFLLLAVLVLWWDSLRWQWMPSYWQQSVAAYGGLHWAHADTLPLRATQWARLLELTLGWPVWLAGVVAGWSLWRAPRPLTLAHRDTLLLLGSAGYLALHLITTLEPWDRYALPLVPVLSLLMARLLHHTWAYRSQPAWQRVAIRRTRQAVATLLLIALPANSLLGLSPRLALADAGLYRGVELVAARLRASESRGAVVYQHRLGWHYSFYLYRAPLEVRWWAAPETLAVQASAESAPRRLVALAAGDDPAAVRAALQRHGLDLVLEFAATDEHGQPTAARLYRITSAQPLSMAAGALHDGR